MIKLFKYMMYDIMKQELILYTLTNTYEAS